MVQRYLLDSHVLIWLLYEPERIGPRTTKLLQEAEAVLVSAVSLWELSLKHEKRKLAYSPQSLTDGASAAGLEALPLELEHNLRLKQVELTHNDPFDRMLLAQCIAEQCTLVTADGLLLGSKHRVRDVRT